MMQSITNAVLNTIFVSIPETLVWCVFVLILLKRKDMLDIYLWKENLKQIILIVSLPVSISINLMRYILHVDNLVNFITIEIMMCSLIIYMIRKNNFLNEKLNYIKIIFYVILADFIVIITTEGLCVLIVTLILNMTIEQINNNICLNICISILPRVFQILIISFCLYKQSFGKMINCVELILKNKILTISMVIFLFTVGLSNYFLQRFIISTHYLNQYILYVQIFFIILLILMPVILITSYIVSIVNLLLENSKLQVQKDNIYMMIIIKIERR